ncbi:universal stress protein [Anthocerotibacter panamensis]|uniref:universal stress protein n=1 Tax=Anthocerotibacter panamensis TaxID=2857077 RepID=UPI001C408C06|nr:universal stress protein [Anthocerotibacter panamensis]
MENNGRLDPQQLLMALLQTGQGRHKVYLGYAPGVGKTQQMLKDALALKAQGVDIVVGWFDIHGRPGMEGLLEPLEVIAPKLVTYQGVAVPLLDVEAIRLRRPATVLVDELAYRNPPGYPRRYQEVQQLLEAGISVFSTVNIQHLERQAPAASRILDQPVGETVPDLMVLSADEVRVLDLSPADLRERLKAIYGREVSHSPLFLESTLNYLRELALRTVAEKVDLQILSEENPGVAGPAGVRERILVAISTNPDAQRLIRRGGLKAQRLDAEFFVLYVENHPLNPQDQTTLQAHIRLAESLGAQFIRYRARDISGALLAFIRERHITQVILGESLRSPWEVFMHGGSIIHRLLRNTSNLDVLIVGETESTGSLCPLAPPIAPVPPAQLGHHKVYIGAAPGVGKTFAMLQTAQALQKQGVDVVAGVIETHGRAQTAALMEGLTVIPKRIVAYQGRRFEEFDLEAVLQRHPRVVLVDELAHTNIPSRQNFNTKRYQDVQTLLSQGIDVISTVNIQHLESLNVLVERTTGVRVRETVPDRILEEAEITLIDLTPEELQERMREGKIYSLAKVEQALQNFFRRENLSALRELALREVADTLEPTTCSTPTQDCILVCVKDDHPQLIYRGARIARRYSGNGPGGTAQLVVVYVGPAKPGVQNIAQRTSEMEGVFVHRTASLYSSQRIAQEIAAVAQTYAVTQIVLGESRHPLVKELLFGSVTDNLVRQVRNLDLLIVGTLRASARYTPS